jgi:hypothetical protein
MARPNKKLPSILIQSITIKGRFTISNVIIVRRCATCQLKSQKQKNYPIKEFLFVHSYHPLRLNLIVGFLGVKVTQDSMEVTLEHMRRGD